jgi:hypothetical protein
LLEARTKVIFRIIFSHNILGDVTQIPDLTSVCLRGKNQPPCLSPVEDMAILSVLPLPSYLVTNCQQLLFSTECLRRSLVSFSRASAFIFPSFSGSGLLPFRPPPDRNLFQVWFFYGYEGISLLLGYSPIFCAIKNGVGHEK